MQVLTDAGVIAPAVRHRSFRRAGASSRSLSAGAARFFSDVELAGAHAPVYTKALEPGLAVQAAQAVDDTDETIRRLGLILAAVALGGVGLAGGLGLVVTRTAARPVRELSAAAEHVRAPATSRSESRPPMPTSSAGWRARS